MIKISISGADIVADPIIGTPLTVTSYVQINIQLKIHTHDPYRLHTYKLRGLNHYRLVVKSLLMMYSCINIIPVTKILNSTSR